MLIGIVGRGHVGTTMCQLFPEAAVYDEPLGVGSREEINRCDVAFICVPTPMAADGACDTSIVEGILDWIEAKTVVLRSTVPVGFTDRMMQKTGKHIVFQPEYYGETVNHPFADPLARSWITLGGNKEDLPPVVRVYQQVFTSAVAINQVDAKTAELAKYMENCFLAAKVTFCNEFYDLAQKLGVDYTDLRETWLMDPRIGRSHTFVYPDKRGFSGSCLPKDLSAMIDQGDKVGADTSLLKAIREKNKGYFK